MLGRVLLTGLGLSALGLGILALSLWLMFRAGCLVVVRGLDREP